MVHYGKRGLFMEKSPALLLLKEISFSPLTMHIILFILFFVSGCSALIYQIIWQRMLFTMFGVDLESITIVVSVFMFGLGIGGLCGGYIADVLSQRLLALYTLIELAIAAFGFCSGSLLEYLGNTMISYSEVTTAAVSFLVLGFPTILMGATFPILVKYVDTFNQHIGRSVGSLYVANTLGGAAGAFFSGFVLLYIFDLVGAVDYAACLNLTIAISAFILFRKKM